MNICHTSSPNAVKFDVSHVILLITQSKMYKNTVLGYKKGSNSEGDTGFESATQTLRIVIFTTFY